MKINYRERITLRSFTGNRALSALNDNSRAESDIRTIRSMNDETKTYIKGSYREFANSYRSAQDGPMNNLR